MASAELQRFLEMLFGDGTLQSELRGIAAPEDFVAAVVASARERGLAVDADDVAGLMNANRRTWIERWIA